MFLSISAGSCRVQVESIHLEVIKERKKKEAGEEKEALSGSLFKYYKSDTSTPTNPDELAIVLVGDQTDGNPEDDGHTPTEGNVDVNMDDSNVSDHEPIFNSYAVESTSVDEEQVSVDIYDPSNWGNLDNKARDILVEKGPKMEEENNKYPLDENSRHFSYSHYYSRKMSNGEVRDRKWLVFSKHTKKVFCFCCKLFNSDKCKSAMGNDGFCDWRHINERLKEHEASDFASQNVRRNI